MWGFKKFNNEDSLCFMFNFFKLFTIVVLRLYTLYILDRKKYPYILVE